MQKTLKPMRAAVLLLSLSLCLTQLQAHGFGPKFGGGYAPVYNNFVPYPVPQAVPVPLPVPQPIPVPQPVPVPVGVPQPFILPFKHHGFGGGHFSSYSGGYQQSFSSFGGGGYGGGYGGGFFKRR